jgi:CrcB protein
VIWFAIAVAGAFGAMARVLVDAAIRRRPGDAAAARPGAGAVPSTTSTTVRTALVTGAVTVNVVGAAVAGAIAAFASEALVPDELVTVVAGGFLGAFTTFSTAMVEVLDLLQRGATGPALVRASVPVVAAVLAAAAGFAGTLALVS